MKRLLQTYRCKDSHAARRQLRRWYQTPLGDAVARTEQAVLEEILPNLFGYHLLQLGAPMQRDILTSSRITHPMIMDDLPALFHGGSATSGAFLGQSEALPVASDSLDVLVLPHILEFAGQPHEVLREAERVLIPEGHVVILCFNPFSLFGARRLLSGWRDDAPWCGHFYSAMRIKDWLALLGFDTVRVRNYFFRLPLQHQRLLRSLERVERGAGRYCAPLGGGYVLVAKKRVATLTPIKPSWRSRRGLLPVGAAEPTARRDRT